MKNEENCSGKEICNDNNGSIDNKKEKRIYKKKIVIPQNILEDNESSKDPLKHGRKSISKLNKEGSWKRYMGDKKFKSKCPWCNSNHIDPFNFHSSHIISDKNGGLTEPKNLVPLCARCNLEMSSHDMDKYLDEKNIPDKVLTIYDNETTKIILKPTTVKTLARELRELYTTKKFK